MSFTNVGGALVLPVEDVNGLFKRTWVLVLQPYLSITSKVCVATPKFAKVYVA